MTGQMKRYIQLLLGCMTFLTILLWYEYVSFQKETEKMIALQGHYYSCINQAKHVLCKQQEAQQLAMPIQEHFRPEGDQNTQENKWLNRTASHLKESALTYFKELL